MFFLSPVLTVLTSGEWKNPPAFTILTTFLREWRSERYAWMSKYMHTASCICSPEKKNDPTRPGTTCKGSPFQKRHRLTSAQAFRYIGPAIIIQTGKMNGQKTKNNLLKPTSSMISYDTTISNILARIKGIPSLLCF